MSKRSCESLFEVLLTSKAEKGLKNAPEHMRASISDIIDSLENTYFPRGHDIKKMKGVENTYRIRIGDYRLIYQVDFKDRRIFVLAIGRRKNIY